MIFRDLCTLFHIETMYITLIKNVIWLSGLERKNGFHKEMNNPASVSMLSGLRKPQIRF